MGKEFCEESHPSLAGVIARGDALLLFPGPNAKPLCDINTSTAYVGTGVGTQAKTPYKGSQYLIVIDGTWRHAKQIFNSPLLVGALASGTLTQVSFTSSHGEGGYGVVRREPEKGCFSTLEAIALALEALDPRDVTCGPGKVDGSICGGQAMGCSMGSSNDVAGNVGTGGRVSEVTRCSGGAASASMLHVFRVMIQTQSEYVLAGRAAAKEYHREQATSGGFVSDEWTQFSLKPQDAVDRIDDGVMASVATAGLRQSQAQSQGDNEPRGRVRRYVLCFSGKRDVVSGSAVLQPQGDPIECTWDEAKAVLRAANVGRVRGARLTMMPVEAAALSHLMM